MDWTSHPGIARAATALRTGAVVAYPTEAVWGLGCDPFDALAVERVLALKQRPMRKGLILVASEMAQFDPLFDSLAHTQRQRLLASWPGPTTWLVPHGDLVPRWIHGDHDTVALRVSSHPVVRALCRAFDGPIVSTSANPAGLPPARSGLKVRCYFGRRVHVAPGVVGGQARPSEIRDLQTGQTLRAG